jgi:hypothetical protein
MGQDTKAWQRRQSITASEDVSVFEVQLEGFGILGPGETTTDAKLSTNSGEVREILGFSIQLPQPENSTTGTYSVELQSSGTNISYLRGESNHDSDLGFNYLNWENADVEQQPPTAAAQTQVLRGLRYGGGNGLDIVLSNNTDGSIPYITPAPENLRKYRVLVKQQAIAL